MNNIVKRQVKNIKKINNLLDQGYSIQKACDEIGICKVTYYNITNKYGKNLEDLNRKLYPSKKHYSEKSNYKSARKTDRSNRRYESEDSESDVELFKSDGTPLKSSIKRKPAELCDNDEVDEQLQHFFRKAGI